MAEEETSSWKPICVASTEGDGDHSPGLEARRPDEKDLNYFKSAEWLVYTTWNK